MTNITILMMSKTKDQALPAHKEPGRWRQGEIVEVFPAQQAWINGGDPCSEEWHMLLHITGVPGTLQQINRALSSGHYNNDDPNQLDTIAHRRFVFDFSLLPSPKLKELQDNKELSFTWAQVKNFIKARNPNARALGNKIIDADLL